MNIFQAYVQKDYSHTGAMVLYDTVIDKKRKSVGSTPGLAKLFSKISSASSSFNYFV